MLPKKNRVDSETIKQIFQKGRFVSSPNLTLKFILSGKPQGARISVVAPKTVAKSAVKRNLLRRRGYAALAEYIDRFPLGLLGAIVFSKNSLELFGGRKNKELDPKTNIANEIKTLLNKIN